MDIYPLNEVDYNAHVQWAEKSMYMGMRERFLTERVDAT